MWLALKELEGSVCGWNSKGWSLINHYVDKSKENVIELFFLII